MNTEELHADEVALLKDLDTSLPALELPADFARQVAVQARLRYQQLPAWRKLQLWGQQAFTSPRSLKWNLGFGSLCGLTALTSPNLLFLLLLLPLALRVSSLSLRPTGVFWVLPGLATLYTGTLFGLLCWSLGHFSISFQKQESLKLIGPITGIASITLLAIALAPTWKALRQRALGHFGWGLCSQLLGGLWLGALLCPLAPPPWGARIFAGIMVWAVVVSLCLRKADPPARRGSLAGALLRSGGSLLLGGVPILAMLGGFFWANLTHEISDPSAYQQLVNDGRRWLEQQEAIPPEQNGWMLVKPWMLKNDNPDMQAIADRLRSGRSLYEHQQGSEKLTSEQRQQKRQEFLQEFPRVQQALARPQFSWVATQGMRFDSLVPNFILCRSVSQGLTALANEALQEGRSDEALDRVLTNLRWSSLMGDQILISLMIELAQLRIALEPIEKLVLQGNLSQAQLGQLQQALEAAQPRPDSLLLAMDRETYAADQFIRSLPNVAPELNSLGVGFWTRLLPRTFWESERKAYLNLHLSHRDGWRRLGQPEHTELPAFNVLANILTPNVSKAQIQFLSIQVQFEALRGMVALELHRRKTGSYPDSLEELPVMPRNAIHPNLWSKKPPLGYQRLGSGYRLQADSSLYLIIDKPPSQSWGAAGATP